jgi:hypothetical protein
MRKETKYAIIIAAGTAIVLLGIWFSFGELNPFYVVARGSMIPNLKTLSGWKNGICTQIQT